MTQAAKQPSTATRSTGGGQPTLDGHGPREHDLRDNQGLVGNSDRDVGNERDDRTERDERNSHDVQTDRRTRAERGEQDLRGGQGRAGDRAERGLRDTRGEQWHGDRGALGDGREPRREPGGMQRTVEQVTGPIRSTTPDPAEAFAAAPDMSKVVTAWFDMAGDMMKLQQQFFAAMLAAGNTGGRPTTKV